MDRHETHTQIRLRVDTITNEEGDRYVSYGVDISEMPEGRLLFSAADLSTDRKAVEDWIRLLRENDVSAVHFADLVEDFLT